MADFITPESDPTNYQRLYAIWIKERKPGYVVIGNQSYRVMQNTDGVTVFQPVSNESMYDSTSFVSG